MGSAVRADTPRWRFAEEDPASASHGLEAVRKGLPCRAGSRDARRVHAAEVLREEVFAVEVVVGLLRCLVSVLGSAARGRGLELSRGARAQIAAVDARAEVLRRDVAFPFVLGAEAGGAAVAAKGADERAGVRGEDVFLERRY